MIEYRIASLQPEAHYFDLTLTITEPDHAGQKLRLPAWIPGSYMIRDFARHVVEISAEHNNKKLSVEIIDKSTWQIEPCQGELMVRYRVYAWDLSVRGAHLDLTHGFFNGTSVFLEVLGQSNAACHVIVEKPVHKACEQWKLATSLPLLNDAGNTSIHADFGTFIAQNYDELIDHPMEMADFEHFSFDVNGVNHEMALTGRFSCDFERLKNDLVKICQQQAALFDNDIPMSRYLFLVMVVGDGYGGLEHRSSTSLLCSRRDLPVPGSNETDRYEDFLGLCSHEYFHSWNVKRITPRVYQQADLTTEVYTPLLWAFEGITSYYDDLALVRCGCITRERYLELLGQTMTRVHRGLGRTRQSAADSSRVTWSRFYKQDENSANGIVSYYAKGSLIALCIDMLLRQKTQNQRSLDDVMRRLWQQYRATGEGVDDSDIQQIISDLCEQDMSDILFSMIETVEELPLAECLSHVNVMLEYRASCGHQDRGGKSSTEVAAVYLGMAVKETVEGLKVLSVVENGPAQQGGISAGDVIIALNNIRANLKDYQQLLKTAPSETVLPVTLFRRDELYQLEVEVTAAPMDTVFLQLPQSDSAELAAWLGDKSRN